ncbi:MAG: ClbS/DfsB family four-helix bundle protein [Chloroflexi bacterium]|nr:ClbS/DfsB family four-helix bundle protein [Chloroflexota bacterium]
MGRQELVEDYQNARQKLMDVLDGLEDDAFLRPGAVGIWSVKDTLAHLTAWESELVTALVRIENGNKGAPKIAQVDDLDEFNEELYRQNARRGMQVIWDDLVGIKKHLIEAIQALSDKTLDDNRIFPWMEGEALSYLIYENAIWHEEEHAEDILAWREEQGI